MHFWRHSTREPWGGAIGVGSCARPARAASGSTADLGAGVRVLPAASTGAGVVAAGQGSSVMLNGAGDA